ncbi:hypothetical protein F5Y05DRAFT_414176 [Hypoxylon sp. FL0543]|nr:hypothetical protein F5Y05DRAFT_414176 [Hypoxylon sp. FL0543]
MPLQYLVLQPGRLRKTSPRRAFHLFLRLPAELQLLIWEFYQADRGIIRHCFSKSSGLLIYTPFEENKRLFAYNFADPEGDTNVLFYTKISLKAASLLSPKHPLDSTARVERMLTEHPTTPGQFISIWVDFKQDIFCFCDGCLGFFSGNMKYPLRHRWVSDFKKLALRLKEDTLDGSVEHTLVRMKYLKIVWLVVKELPGDEHRIRSQDGDALHPKGLANLEGIETCSGQRLDAIYGGKYNIIRDQLVGLFTEHDMKMKIEVGVDLYQRSYHTRDLGRLIGKSYLLWPDCLSTVGTTSRGISCHDSR